MCDESDDGGYMKGESFLINSKSFIHIKQNQDKEQRINNSYEEEYNNGNYNYSYIDSDNSIMYDYSNYIKYNNEDYNNRNYNYSYINSNNSMYDYSYIKYDNEDYFQKSKNFYKHRRYDEDNKNDNNSFNQKNIGYNKKYYNRNNYKRNKYSICKGKDFYLSSFSIKFKNWLLKTLIKDKKKIIFTKNKKVNKEIKQSLKHLYNIYSNKINEKENIKLNIREIEIKPVVANNINIEFKLIIEEELEVFFIKKYIEIKGIGELSYKNIAKFYFIFNEWKISLLDWKKKDKDIENQNNEIKTIKRNEDDEFSKIIELDLYSKNYIEEEKSKENEENNRGNNFENIDFDKDLKICLNLLMENL